MYMLSIAYLDRSNVLLRFVLLHFSPLIHTFPHCFHSLFIVFTRLDAYRMVWISNAQHVDTKKLLSKKLHLDASRRTTDMQQPAGLWSFSVSHRQWPTGRATALLTTVAPRPNHRLIIQVPIVTVPRSYDKHLGHIDVQTALIQLKYVSMYSL
jgi:hypothetical protein